MALFDAVKMAVLILLILLLTPVALRETTHLYTSFFDTRTKIGVLPIRGIIYDSSFYIEQLQHYFTDPDIKGIVLKIDCPGTAFGTGETIYTEIQALKRLYHKPVIGFIENIGTSGGYWIACASDYLIAPGTAIIGNIGSTIPAIFHCKDFLNQHHISYADTKIETYQPLFNPFIEPTNQDKELLGHILQDTYQQFIQVVAQARKLSLAKIDQWADGKTFTGQQALKVHLIDEIGSPQRIDTILKQKALIEGKINWIYPSTSCQWLQTIFGMSNVYEIELAKRIVNILSRQT